MSRTNTGSSSQTQAVTRDRTMALSSLNAITATTAAKPKRMPSARTTVVAATPMAGKPTASNPR